MRKKFVTIPVKILSFLLITLYTGGPLKAEAQTGSAGRWRPITPHLEMNATKETCVYRLRIVSSLSELVLYPTSYDIDFTKGGAFVFPISKFIVRFVSGNFEAPAMSDYESGAGGFFVDASLIVTSSWPELNKPRKYDFEYVTASTVVTRSLTQKGGTDFRLEELCQCETPTPKAEGSF